MHATGRCYCGALRYVAEGEPLMRAQCHCRECQYATGGGVNMIMVMPLDGFRWTAGVPAEFRRPDLPEGLRRLFCATCGTQVAALAPAMPNAINLRVGTLDEPTLFVGPQMATCTAEAQAWHSVPDGAVAFEHFPA